MNIVGVESLIYGSEDLEAAKRFYGDWGLDLVAETADGADFALADGTGTLHSIDDLGYRIGFRVTARHEAGLGFPETNTVGTVTRRDTRAEAVNLPRIRQLRFSHVVYWVPGDPANYAKFYIDRLGFKLTEGIKDKAMFMRCALAHDHHNLFLQHGGQNFGFQHVAYEVRDLDEVMMLGNRMEDQGWLSHLGPGRHVLGSNTYWYFWCAAGGVVETGSDMDHITDDWQAKIYDDFPGGRTWHARPSDAGLRPGHGDWPTTADALSPIPAA